LFTSLRIINYQTNFYKDPDNNVKERETLISSEVIGTLSAFGAALCWGSAGVLYKAIIKTEHSLFLSIVYRGIVAVPFLVILTVLTTGFNSLSILFQYDVLPVLLLSSLCVTLGDLFFFAALQKIDVSIAQPVAAIYPLFTIILLIVFGVEQVSLVVILATIILIIGIGLVSQKNDSSSEPTEAENSEIRLGLMISIVAAIFWSFAILTLDHLLEIPGVEVFSLATIRFGILTVIMALCWVVFDKYQIHSRENMRSYERISMRDGLIFGLTGILSWGLGAVTFFTSLELIGTSRATPISSINPIIAVILGIIFLKEKFSTLQTLGILLVCFGTIIISIF
jgi:DME family drug/metabolite transporter